MTKRFFPLAACLLLLSPCFAQQNRILYNNQQLFLSGANLAWLSFANDIGPAPTNFAAFADVMLQMHDHGGNALRWWLHTNGVNSPEFDNAGFVVGPGAGTIEDMKTVLDLAWEREIGVKLCLWSFDMLRSNLNAVVLNRNRLMLNDTTFTRAYIDNCLIPMVDALKGHPAIIAWEIFNEPEGMSNEFGWSEIQHVPMESIQRFINLCAGAIHRTDTTAQVTSGSWSFLAMTDVPTSSLGKVGAASSQPSAAEKADIEVRFEQKYGFSLSADEIFLHFQKAASRANMNYYSDNRLIAAGGDPDGVLDFYSVHYYDWGGTAISPFHHVAEYWGLDKAIVVAEFHMKTTFGIPKQSLYEVLYINGYAGALGWSWTDNAVTQPVDLLAGMQYMWDHYQQNVDVAGIGGDWPLVSITSPASGTEFPDGAEVTITAEASDKDGSVVLVEFFASDTLKIGEAAAAPFTVTWTNIPAGNYLLTAIATDNQGHQRISNRVPIKVGTPQVVRLEAEAATRQGQGITVRSNPNASNGAYVEMRTQTGTITWQLPNVPAAGSYEIGFGYRLSFDTPKDQYINVNGARVTALRFDGPVNVWAEKKLVVNLVQGSNSIQMQLYWGWMDLDYLSIPLVVTSVESDPASPANFFLQQNYPNPFNPLTTIGYNLAEPEQVRLAVYDITGREVTVLVDKRQDAGSHSVSFDGRSLASGVYYYRIKAGAFVDEKRMLLLK